MQHPLTGCYEVIGVDRLQRLNLIDLALAVRLQLLIGLFRCPRFHDTKYPVCVRGRRVVYGIRIIIMLVVLFRVLN